MLVSATSQSEGSITHAAQQLHTEPNPYRDGSSSFQGIPKEARMNGEPKQLEGVMESFQEWWARTRHYDCTSTYGR